MTQLVVNIEDNSLVNDIKRAIKLLRGVQGVKALRTKKSELDKAIEEVNEGKLYEAEDVDDLMRQLNA